MTLDELQHCLNTQFSSWISDLQLQITHTDANSLSLILPFNPRFQTPSTRVCTQTYTVAAETAMVLALARSSPDIATIRCIATNMSFINTVNAGEIKIVASLLRRGRSIAFGEVNLYDENSELIAQANLTYALQ